MKRKRSHQRFEEVAQLLLQVPTYRELAQETSYSETYCRQVVSQLVRKLKRTNVSIHVEHSEDHTSVR